MNCATRHSGRKCFLVAGQESHCQFYHVNISVVDVRENGSSAGKKEDHSNKPRRRRKSGSEEKSPDPDVKTENVDSNGNSYRKLQFVIKPNDSVQTDFSEKEPVQRVVRIGRSGKLMATAGTDGYVRLWSFPAMEKKLDIQAHSKEVDDVDFSPDEKWVASISKDSTCVLWDTESGKKVGELKWPAAGEAKYLFKRCRFSTVEENPGASRLFSIANPVGRPGRHKSYLQLWDPSQGELRRDAPFTESLSALAVSDSGRFVAVGTMFSGSVSMHVSFSLQRVLWVKGAHSMFVTGLEFLPQALDGPPVTSTAEAAVLSISVDNRVCIHSLAHRRSMPFWLAILLIVVTMFSAFVFCSYVGL
ncbi:prolactin regulatory element-binding protein isoform X2 [Bacillus rossius redtenbacheri]